MATYVKAWAFFVAIIALSISITTTAVLYNESQSTQDLLRKLTTDFESKMVTITTNNSALMSSLMATFQQQLANSTIQIEALATAKGNLEAQVTTLTGQVTALQTLYDNLEIVVGNINTSWANFLKAFNKGLLKLKISNSSIAVGQTNFTDSYNYFLATDYPNAISKATSSMSNYNNTRNLFNETNTYFQSAANKVDQEWTNTYVGMYVNLHPIELEMTSQMIQTNYYLRNASQLYSVGNTTGGASAITTMKTHWNLYNSSYSSYLNATKAIDALIASL